MNENTKIARLGAGDLLFARRALDLFGEVFKDRSTYSGNQPSDAWLAELLDRSGFVFQVALDGERVIGAMASYVLRKFEQERKEIYIYDLAVADRRREGIATALIADLQRIATQIGAYVIYVQADHGDAPAIALYEKFGAREEVLHFDIAPS